MLFNSFDEAMASTEENSSIELSLLAAKQAADVEFNEQVEEILIDTLPIEQELAF